MWRNDGDGVEDERRIDCRDGLGKRGTGAAHGSYSLIPILWEGPEMKLRGD
jgi:hypothetical protein